MARYTNAVVFNGFEDFSEELQKKLKIFSVTKVSINENELTIVGKGHPELWKKIPLAGDEKLDDFEGIDDESKQIGHTFPMEKANGILQEAFGYAGTIQKISDDNILFLRTESMSDEINDLITEKLEEASALISVDDDKEAIIETAFDVLISIANIIGNKTMEDELVANKLNNM